MYLCDNRSGTIVCYRPMLRPVSRVVVVVDLILPRRDYHFDIMERYGIDECSRYSLTESLRELSQRCFVWWLCVAIISSCHSTLINELILLLRSPVYAECRQSLINFLDREAIWEIIDNYTRLYLARWVDSRIHRFPRFTKPELLTDF